VTFRTFYVSVVISHGRRRVEYWNVTRYLTAAWLWQHLIEATAWGRQPRT
jgi:hypothetical protein